MAGHTNDPCISDGHKFWAGHTSEHHREAHWETHMLDWTHEGASSGNIPGTHILDWAFVRASSGDTLGDTNSRLDAIRNIIERHTGRKYGAAHHAVFDHGCPAKGDPVAQRKIGGLGAVPAVAESSCKQRRGG